jgi:glycosyltransferase involved in cell wall biosynthesis
MHTVRILLIIPAFNEAKNLPTLLSEIRQHYSQYDVVVIDDASVDQTAQIAESHHVPVAAAPLRRRGAAGW